MPPKAPHRLDAPLIVTLTSYPPRFRNLARTVVSLLDQTLAADGVILWIAAADCSSLPQELVALEDYGLTIRECADLGSYKKLIPALQERPDSYLVTADDDVYYPPEWLESLVAVARERPRTVVGARVHLARLDAGGRLEPYGIWEHATKARQARGERQRLFPTGVGGVLYPPAAFSPEVTNEAAFKRLCPRGDDIWFFWMSRLAGTEQCRARDWFEIVEWPGTAEFALWQQNVGGGGNDEQIRAMEASYGMIP
jgi:glycosyltransferase involved in cell wall biosynthesis